MHVTHFTIGKWNKEDHGQPMKTSQRYMVEPTSTMLHIKAQNS